VVSSSKKTKAEGTAESVVPLAGVVLADAAPNRLEPTSIRLPMDVRSLQAPPGVHSKKGALDAAALQHERRGIQPLTDEVEPLSPMFLPLDMTADELEDEEESSMSEMGRIHSMNSPLGEGEPQRLAITVPSQAPSVGSLLHGAGCRPCAWFWKPGGCKNGEECCHCHLCPRGEVKARKKAKLAEMRRSGAHPVAPATSVPRASCPSMELPSVPLPVPMPFKVQESLLTLNPLATQPGLPPHQSALLSDLLAGMDRSFSRTPGLPMNAMDAVFIPPILPPGWNLAPQKIEPEVACSLRPL